MTYFFDSVRQFIILLAHGLPIEAIMILYWNTKVKVRDTEYFNIVAGLLHGDTQALYFFIICQFYVLRTSIEKIKENGFELTKKRWRGYHAKTITDADYADDIAIQAYALAEVETLLHCLMYSYGPHHMAEQNQGDQLEPIYSSSVFAFL